MLVLGYGLMAICAVSAFLTAQTMPGVGFREVLLPVSGAILAWALLLRPSVDIGEQAVTVRNVVRDVQIPWARIESIQTSSNLRIATDSGVTYRSWAIARQWVKRLGDGRASAAAVAKMIEARQHPASEPDVGREVRSTPAWSNLLPLVTAAGIAVYSSLT